MLGCDHHVGDRGDVVEIEAPFRIGPDAGHGEGREVADHGEVEQGVGHGLTVGGAHLAEDVPAIREHGFNRQRRRGEHVVPGVHNVGEAERPVDKSADRLLQIQVDEAAARLEQRADDRIRVDPVIRGGLG